MDRIEEEEDFTTREEVANDDCIGDSLISNFIKSYTERMDIFREKLLNRFSQLQEENVPVRKELLFSIILERWTQSFSKVIFVIKTLEVLSTPKRLETQSCIGGKLKNSHVQR